MGRTKSTKRTEPVKKQAVSKRTEVERALNIGIKVSLAKLGGEEVEVQEIPLEDLLVLGPQLAILLEAVSEIDTETGGDFGWIIHLIQKPEILELLQALAVSSTKQDIETFQGMGLADWIKLAAAFKEVTDWGGMKAAFFALVPPEMVATLKEAMKTQKVE